MASFADRVDALHQWQREKNYEETKRNALAQILQGAYTPPTQGTPGTPGQSPIDQNGNFTGQGPLKFVDPTPAIPASPGGYDYDRVTQALAGSRFAPEALGMLNNNFQMQNDLKKLLFQKQLQTQMMQDAWNQVTNGGVGSPSGMGAGGSGGVNGIPLGVNFEWTPQGAKFGVNPADALKARTEANTSYFNTGLDPYGNPQSVRPAPSGGMAPAMPGSMPSAPGMPAQSGGLPNYGGMSPKDVSEARKTMMTNRAQQDYQGVNDFQKNLIDKSTAAVNTLNILSQMRDLSQNFTPGKLTPAWATFAQYAQAVGAGDFAKKFGALDPNAASSVQEFDKLSSQLVSAQIKDTGNRLMEKEFELFKKNNPNPTYTPQALSQMLDFMQRASMYHIQNLSDFNGLLKQNPNMTAAQAADWMNKRTLGDIQANSGSVVNKPAQGTQIPQIPQQLMSRLPRGAKPQYDTQTGRFVFTPDGQNYFDLQTGQRVQ